MLLSIVRFHSRFFEGRDFERGVRRWIIDGLCRGFDHGFDE